MNPSTSAEFGVMRSGKDMRLNQTPLVLVEDEDLNKLAPEPSTRIQLSRFLPEGHIGH